MQAYMSQCGLTCLTPLSISGSRQQSSLEAGIIHTFACSCLCRDQKDTQMRMYAILPLRCTLYVSNSIAYGLLPEYLFSFLGHMGLALAPFFFFPLPHISWLPFQIVISFKHLLSHPWHWARLLSSILTLFSLLTARLYTSSHCQIYDPLNSLANISYCHQD